jgi:hypothetical protein
MQSNRKPIEARPGQQTTDVQHNQHSHHDNKSCCGRQLIPMRRNEQRDPRSQKDCAKYQRKQNLPAEAGRPLARRFKETDTLGCRFVKNTGTSPALQCFINCLHAYARKVSNRLVISNRIRRHEHIRVPDWDGGMQIKKVG